MNLFKSKDSTLNPGESNSLWGRTRNNRKCRRVERACLRTITPHLCSEMALEGDQTSFLPIPLFWTLMKDALSQSFKTSSKVFGTYCNFKVPWICKGWQAGCDRFHAYFPLSRTYEKGEEEQYRKDDGATDKKAPVLR